MATGVEQRSDERGPLPRAFRQLSLVRPVLQIFLIAFSFLSCAHADDSALAKVFSDAGVEGTLVIASLNGSDEFIHDRARAARRLPVASTFKIFNSLIALEERVISGPDDTFIWDGRVHQFPDWNRDHTLRSAFKFSCVWCYQELARRIGAVRYRIHIKRAEYGVLRDPFNLTTFWLDRSLEASALEQVELLRKIILRSLPYSSSSLEYLREIMVRERGQDYVLRAKTGWATEIQPQVGWYVGYIEKAGATWIFATNIDIKSEKDLPLREHLTSEALRAKGIIK